MKHEAQASQRMQEAAVDSRGKRLVVVDCFLLAVRRRLHQGRLHCLAFPVGLCNDMSQAVWCGSSASAAPFLPWQQRSIVWTPGIKPLGNGSNEPSWSGLVMNGITLGWRDGGTASFFLMRFQSWDKVVTTYIDLVTQFHFKSSFERWRTIFQGFCHR